MESRHDSIHARHPILLQVQEEVDVPEAYNYRVCKRCGVLGQRIDPSQVHDLRNPHQAQRRVPLHPYPAVQADPLHSLQLFGKPGANQL